MSARGVLYVHSCPPVLCPHVEWAVGQVLGVAVHLKWSGQPANPGHLRGEARWRAPAGSAGRIASALRAWPALRAEITEDPSGESEGERYAITPSLGVFRTAMSANGDVLVHEGRLLALLAAEPAPGALVDGLRRLLGQPWDEELEPYRLAGDGAPETWLTQTG